MQPKTGYIHEGHTLIARVTRYGARAGLAAAILAALASAPLRADVATGSEEKAKHYYTNLSKSLGFSTPERIFDSTLGDVATFLGYAGITGQDLQNLPSRVLMDPELLLAPCDPPTNCTNMLQNRDQVVAALGSIPIRPDDILVSRFFAPKIMDIKAPEETRQLGWRKLVRLRARPGSAAEGKKISSAIILFNIFTQPGATPFTSADESVNTQVMLVTDPAHVPRPNSPGLHALYWLDYDRISKGGKLSLALDATFDANELPALSAGVRPYFVPDGCVACHGNNERRSLVNYLDTDHWFDRLSTDFQALKAQGLPLLFDAGTNDTNALPYKIAFDVVRRFNKEADNQAERAQPKHDETLAAQKWLRLHEVSNAHLPPPERAIGASPTWSSEKADEVRVLNALNQYCFRCHGTVKFSVFNKQAVRARRANLKERIRADAPTGMRMPPDRPLPDDIRTLLLEHIR